MTRVHRDRYWWRSRGGRGLVAGTPGTYFGVTEEGARVLDAIEADTEVPDSHLLERLVAAGAAHPFPGPALDPGEITVVIPVRCRTTDEAERVAALVAALAPLEVVVVDDASSVAPITGRARTVRHEENLGPGAARNSGSALVRTPFVAFVDADVTARADDLCALGGHFADPRVSFVAPRIVCEAGRSFLSRYESLRSPLDMGPRPARVRRGSSVPYVPSAVLVARTAALGEGFDASLRTGEDVDFVWRAENDGAQCRYEPSVECAHDPRPTWTGLIAQRYAYGTSAAALDARHPWSVAPVRGHLLHLLPFALLLAGETLWALDAAFVSFAYSTFALRRMRLGSRATARIAVLNVVSAARRTGAAMTREWSPVLVLGVPFIGAFQLPLLLCVSVTLMAGIVRTRPDNIALWAPTRIIEDFAYGAGVWVGAVRNRSLRCLLPAVSLRRRRGEG